MFRPMRGFRRYVTLPRVEIRAAKPEDVPQVLPMVEKICALHESWDPAKYGFLANPSQRYARWMSARASDPRSVFLVAEREGRLVGFIVATIEKEIPIYRLDEFGFIHDLWVEPEYRNEGIARQMTMLLIERFREIGVKQIRCDTSAKNDAARKLFASCGFRPSVTEMLLEI
jgi:ribosomal protein S18 acetylase RimI-like enzyme